jgi:hypothetical protein
MDEARWERDAEKIYCNYDRKKMFAEFLENLSGEVNEASPLTVAVQQRDFEAAGGLLVEAFDVYLSECADYDARRVQDWA